MTWSKIKKSTDISVMDVIAKTKYHPEVDGVSQSMLNTFLFCKRKFLFSVNLWQLPSDQKRFELGTLVHDQLDKVYTYRNKSEKNPKLHWEDTPAAKTAKILVTEYFKFYQSDFEKFENFVCEEIFDVKYRTYRLRGKIDMRFNLGDEKWVFETKTKSKIPNGLLDQLVFNTQNLFYLFAQDILLNDKLYKVLYNIIRNPGLRLKNTENDDGLLQRVKADIQKRPEFYFMRHELIYTQLEKSVFKSELIQKLDDIKICSEDTRKCYKNETNCVNPYPCEFLRACSTGKMQGYIQKKELFTELQNKDAEND